MNNILITGALHPDTISSFKNNVHFNLEYKPDCSREELLASLTGIHVLISRSETTIDREVIEKASDLKLIARAAVGIGNIDVELATEKGILVINCPGKNTNSAAELTMALLLNMFRHVVQAHTTLSQGGWERHKFTGLELQGKTLGIIGLGNVGHRVAKFAQGFDMQVSAYDPYIAPSLFQKYRVKKIDNLSDLLRDNTIVSVHVPLNRETKGMIAAPELATMQAGSFILNAARGGVIDELALVNALNSGHIAGAGIDTFLAEPKPDQRLVQHENVICTPHIGATTIEAQKRIGETTYRQVEKFCAGGVVDYPVNLPSIGVIDDPLLKAYSTLSEKLGSVLAQILPFNPTSFTVSYRGNISEKDHSLIRLGLMKGYVDQLVEDYVSFVNAEQRFENFGIKFIETEDPDFTGYRSAVKVCVRGRDNHEMTLGGIVFDDNYPRISLLNGYHFEVEPIGKLLIIENEDQPGVIGQLGHFLGERQVNINSFNLSRNKKGGKAMAIISLDDDISKADLNSLAQINHINSAKIVRL